MAARASEPPTLMRRTPMAAISFTVNSIAQPARKFTGFGATALHHRLDLLAGSDARRVEAVGAGVRVGFEPANDVVEIGHAANEVLGAGGEHDIAAGAVDGGARGLDARDGRVELVERLRVFRRILDR